MKLLDRHQLKTLRIIANIPAKDLAKEMYSTKQTISSIETGKTKAKSSLHHYQVSLFDMIERLDAKRRKACHEMIKYYESKEG